MKKILQLIILISINVAVYAQPVINSTDFDNLNIFYTRKVASSTTLNQGAAGANVTWNFSSLVPVLDLNPNEPGDNGITTITQVATGPFSSSFPSANYVWKAGDGTANTSSNFYTYLNKTATKLETLGGGGNTQIDFSYVNPSTVFVFPFSFGMVATDTSQETATSSVTTEVQTYDGYGTLITSFGTFTNVIRIKNETIGTPNDVSYNWYKVNPFRFIMSSYRSSATLVNFEFADPTPLSVNDFSKSQINVYPNPANNILNIKLSDNDAISTIVITDLAGKKILEQNGNKTTINIESLATGLYVLEVVSGGNKMVEKFVKQ